MVALKETVPLLPTNLPGVSLFPPLPAEFDPHSVSPEELIRHGVVLPRPDEKAGPPAIAAWSRLIGHFPQGAAHARELHNTMALRAKNLRPQPGITHHIRGARNVSPTFNTMPPNWNGVGVQGLGWYMAQGTFVVPSIYVPFDYAPSQYDGGYDASIWVGLDGYDTLTGGGFVPGDVLQAGVSVSIDPTGNATYTPWFEWYVDTSRGGAPQPSYVVQTNLPFLVRPGDVIQIIVSLGQGPLNNIGNIYFANLSRFIPPFFQPPAFGYPPVSFTLDRPSLATGVGGTAEWIVENPSLPGPGNDNPSTLPNFGVVQFSSSFATATPRAGGGMSDLTKNNTIFAVPSAGKTIWGDLYPFQTATNISSSTSAEVYWAPPIIPPPSA
jgi:Peptidase A4 family